MGSSSTVTYWPMEVMARWSRRRGPVVRTRIGTTRYAWLLSPEGNDLVFAHDDWFAVGTAMKLLTYVDGPTSVIASDGPDHRRRRELLRPALAPRTIENYLEAMRESAAEALAELPRGEAVDVYPVFRSAIRRANLRALFGPTMAADADRLGDLLQPLLDFIEQLPQAVETHRVLRTPRWRRVQAARAELDCVIDARIDESEAGRGHGILDVLVHGRDGAGSGLSRQEIRDQAVTLVAAGYETTSAAMGWAVYALAHHPRWQEKARAEAVELLAGPLTRARLDALIVLPAVLKETLRLYPPVTMSARTATQDLDILGTHVREGDWVMFSAYAAHRDPANFERPLDFDPSRWIDGPAPRSGTYLPWGGGAHRCAGSHMATAELTVMLAHLLAAGPFEPDGPKPRATAFASMRPTAARVVIR